MPKPAVKILAAKEEDILALAAMNRDLIRDEGSINKMSLPELEARMKKWLAGEYKAVLVMLGREMIGYCVYKQEPHEYFPGRKRIYIRQYFIKSEHRGRGYGKAAMEKIIKDQLPKNSEVSVDVLKTNPRGRIFWKKAGFKEYLTNLRRS